MRIIIVHAFEFMIFSVYIINLVRFAIKAGNQNYFKHIINMPVIYLTLNYQKVLKILNLKNC